ncbi:hypothetical protein BCV70DRAFT_202299 [Testicularia cyperi]|uniref:Large ribosomal subunit protein mL59 domain-containing protein n=1 Tax=Testicularia cyperi TaxID=1882483 RepID=A0A317XIK9_9BASI|nr:hypothetical protein BCV70DRAFT_202299 [Testicularia cyperi]
MVFANSVVRSSSKHVSAYGTVLDRFLVHHVSSVGGAAASASSSLSGAAAASASASSSSASLFEPTKSETSERWAPPKFSQRRQAKLAKEALLTGRLESLPDGPKVARIQKRMSKLVEHLEFEQASSEFRYVPSGSSTFSASSQNQGRLTGKSVRPRLRVSDQEAEMALNNARLAAKGAGPYAGRGKVFKGSKIDRDSTRRAKDVQNKLANMKDTVKDWQKSRNEAKNKLKPGLPF